MYTYTANAIAHCFGGDYRKIEVWLSSNCDDWRASISEKFGVGAERWADLAKGSRDELGTRSTEAYTKDARSALAKAVEQAHAMGIHPGTLAGPVEMIVEAISIAEISEG